MVYVIDKVIVIKQVVGRPMKLDADSLVVNLVFCDVVFFRIIQAEPVLVIVRWLPETVFLFECENLMPASTFALIRVLARVLFEE